MRTRFGLSHEAIVSAISLALVILSRYPDAFRACAHALTSGLRQYKLTHTHLLDQRSAEYLASDYFANSPGLGLRGEKAPCHHSRYLARYQTYPAPDPYTCLLGEGQWVRVASATVRDCPRYRGCRGGGGVGHGV